MQPFDSSAPLKTRQVILIAAPQDRIWQLLTGIDQWPKWQKGVRSATLHGDLAPGALFHWNATGVNITSTIRELAAPRRIGWTGKSLGLQAVHRWELEPQSAFTRLTVEESLTGWLAWLIKLFDPAFLEKSVQQSLLELQAEAEREPPL